jgi:predicted dehydrogenase
VPEGLDWDAWCGPTEVAPYHADLYAPRAKPGWISFRAYSGGEMTGWGSHGLDQVQWALGMDQSGPLEVWTEGARLVPPKQAEPGPGYNKECSAPKVFFRYAGDVVVELGDGPAGGAIFIGEQGTLTIDRNKATSDPPEIAQEALKAAAAPPPPSHMADWVACIKDRARPVADVEVGQRSATVCHLGNIARLVGRRLRWDPVRETFPDDAEAAALLDRPRRKGYDLPEAV